MFILSVVDVVVIVGLSFFVGWASAILMTVLRRCKGCPALIRR